MSIKVTDTSNAAVSSASKSTNRGSEGVSRKVTHTAILPMCVWC